VQHPLRR